jgi:hypothetical protein
MADEDIGEAAAAVAGAGVGEDGDDEKAEAGEGDGVAYPLPGQSAFGFGVGVGAIFEVEEHHIVALIHCYACLAAAITAIASPVLFLLQQPLRKGKLV